MKGYVGDWIAALFLLTVVYMLVKPSSPASASIGAFATALSSLITTAIGSSNTTGTGTTGTNGAQQ